MGHDLSKSARKLEIEKEELQCALEEAETALENEENKVLRGQLELSQVKQEIDRRVHEKEEEFDSTRKNHQKAIESMQNALEAEAKAKAEALRMKKKLESDINELEISLDHANKSNGDIGNEIKELQDRAMEEQHIASEYREQFGVAERRAHGLHGELEESRTLLEQSDRGRRQAEADLADVHEQLQTLANQNNSLTIAKRKLESEMQTMNADIDDMLTEAKNSEEKAKKAMVDAARLADELRAEQEHTQSIENAKKGLEATYKDLQLRFEESESTALKAGRRALSKLEGRIHELEQQFDEEARRHADAQKNLRKCERRIKELTFQSDEDKKNHERMQELVDKLQLKIKTYKRQIEEAEEIAALNLAKYRKAHADLETHA